MTHRPYNRATRYGQELQKILGDIFLREIETSQVGFVTVSRVIVSKDLKLAKIYISALNSEKSSQEIVSFFRSRKKFIRKCLGSRITSKNVPDLNFFYDDTYIEVERLERLFNKIHHNEERIP